MKVILKDFMRVIPDIEKGRTDFLSEKSPKRKVYIIRGSIMKLLNDEQFNLSAVDNGLLSEFKDWFNNLTAKGGPKISDKFIKGETDWTLQQLFSFWIVAGSQDQFDELLPDRQESLENLIEHSMGNSANIAVKKFIKSKSQQIGLKRKIIEISPNDNNKINEIYEELNSRAVMLIDWANQKDSQEKRQIDFESLWDGAFAGCERELSCQQLQEWKGLSENEIGIGLYSAVKPVPPLENKFIGIEEDKMANLLADIQKKVEEIRRYKGLAGYLKPIPALQFETDLKEVATKLEKIIYLMNNL
ncbi:hypothetical protein [Levilactobacillus brevis]|uniref:hypothetical protein n=1 Tax=Levilactobacillus brevis TaxID=1580 RepID=UPI000A205667|nr:hypothetical protein [Levilactobacillus brevis]ARN89358.1 hypothetical protein AZI09_01690 [Levilactobacillus brevis]ARN96936.1 hypothetical protein AZI10_01675 [Levilactobacillus brevis]